jgi:hypothetical protein
MRGGDVPDGRAGGPGLLRREDLSGAPISATLGGRTSSNELNFRCVVVFCNRGSQKEWWCQALETARDASTAMHAPTCNCSGNRTCAS